MPRLADIYGLINKALTYDETVAPGRIPKIPRRIPVILPEPEWNIRSGLPEPGLGHVAIEDLLPTGIGTKLATLAASLAGKGALVAGAVKSAAKSNLLHNPEERALAFLTAQRNAAKPISEGGLGLRPNNTAEERAAAMGFKGEGYHYSQAEDEVRRLDPLNHPLGMRTAIEDYGNVPADFLGTHVGSKRAAEERFIGLNESMDNPVGSTYPLRFKNDSPRMPHGQPMSDLEVSQIPENVYGIDDVVPSKAKIMKMRRDLFKNNSNIPYYNEYEHYGSLSHLLPPENIRSRFAAFDPAKRGSADLLGYADPRLLGIVAGGTAGGIALNQLLQLNGTQR